MIVIDSFLERDLVVRLRDYLRNEYPWYYSFADVTYPDVPENASAIFEAQTRADALHATGAGMAYSFRRSIGHEGQAECACPICDTARLFQTAKLAGFTTYTGLKLHTLFASYYAPGDFLSPHSDKHRGRIAFVLSLTEGWLPQFGGNLHMLSDDWTRIEEVACPKFNSLVLFDVSGEGKPHFVSPVAQGVTVKRLAISGWFH